MQPSRRARLLVAVATLLVVGSASLCPAQCLAAAVSGPPASAGCHDDGAPADGSAALEEGCCPVGLATRAMAAAFADHAAAVYPAAPVASLAGRSFEPPAPDRSHPPPRLPLRFHPLLI